MNGGKSRSEIILSGEKRALSQMQNPSVTALRHSQRRQCSQCCPRTSRGEWQSRAIAMNKALVFGTKFWCVREGKTMSLQMLREHMTLEGMARLYCRGLDDQWPEEAIAPLRNYLQDVPGFDLSLVRTPSAGRKNPENNMLISPGSFLKLSAHSRKHSGIFLLKIPVISISVTAFTATGF